MQYIKISNPHPCPPPIQKEREIIEKATPKRCGLCTSLTSPLFLALLETFPSPLVERGGLRLKGESRGEVIF